jgi:Ca2+-binding EF-hand superfamily protein
MSRKVAARSRVRITFFSSEFLTILIQQTARNDLSDDQKLELREAFELFDADKTGSIDLHELKV